MIKAKDAMKAADNYNEIEEIINGIQEQIIRTAKRGSYRISLGYMIENAKILDTLIEAGYKVKNVYHPENGKTWSIISWDYADIKDLPYYR